MGEAAHSFLWLRLTLRSERPGRVISERQARGRDRFVPLSPAGSSRRPGPSAPPAPLRYLDDSHEPARRGPSALGAGAWSEGGNRGQSGKRKRKQAAEREAEAKAKAGGGTGSWRRRHCWCGSALRPPPAKRRFSSSRRTSSQESDRGAASAMCGRAPSPAPTGWSSLRSKVRGGGRGSA